MHVDGNPAGGMEIFCPGAEARTTADEEGWFSVEIPPHLESASFFANEEGYVMVRSGIFTRRDVEVPPLVLLAHELRMLVEARYENGEPTAGAVVTVEVEPATLGHDLAGSRSVPTGGVISELGLLEMSVPAVGVLQVTLSADDQYRQKSVPRDQSSHVVFELRRLASPGELVVQGLVIDPDGRGVPEARVGLGRARTLTAGDGRFELRVRSDWMRADPVLYAFHREMGVAHNPTFGLKHSAGDLPPPGARLVLTKGERIHGILRWSDGDRCEDFLITVSDATVLDSKTSGPLTLEALLNGGESVQTDSSGSFSILVPGARKYFLRVEHHGFLLRHVVGPVSPAGAVELVLDARHKPREVVGRVVDAQGEPVAEASVKARALRVEAAGVRKHVSGPETKTAADGTFAIRNVSPLGGHLLIQSASTLPYEISLSEIPANGEIQVPRACRVLVEWHYHGVPPSHIGFLGADGSELVTMTRHGNEITWGRRFPFSSEGGRLFVEVDSSAVEAVFHAGSRELARVPFRCTGELSRLYAP